MSLSSYIRYWQRSRDHMPAWNRLQWTSTISCIRKKWMGAVKINQRDCALTEHLWETSYKPQYCFFFSFSCSPDPLSPHHAIVSPLSCLNSSDFYKHSPLGSKRGLGELAGIDSLNYTEGHHSEAVVYVKNLKLSPVVHKDCVVSWEGLTKA